MVERAVAVDPASSDAWASLGNIRFRASWDWPGAEEAYRRAIALNLNNVRAHERLCEFLDGMRRLDEGWKECQIAQQVDASNDHLSSALERRGQHDLAIAKLLMMLKGQPNDAGLHWLLYHSYKSNGMYKQAVQELENTLTLLGFKEFATRVHRAFAISGYRGAMREWAKELEQAAATKQAFYPLQAAEAYVTIGDKDRAFYWLEKAYQHPDIVEATSNAGLELINTKWLLLDPLRSDPRFKDLVRRVGLPQ